MHRGQEIAGSGTRIVWLAEAHAERYVRRQHETILGMAPTRNAKFKSLADAMRAGCQLVPDPASARRYVGAAESGRLGCDALAAAWFAEFSDMLPPTDPDDALHRDLSVELAAAYPVLSMGLGPGCPSGPQSTCPKRGDVGQSLEAKIIHLQGEHGFGREAVVRWLEAHSF